MLQLELGILPMSKPVEIGMKVAFVRSHRKRRWKHMEIVLGRVVSVTRGRVIVEDLITPGSRYNRSVDKIYSVHKDTELGLWCE